MSMKKIILVLLVIAFLAYPSAAAVSDGTVTRSLSASSAAPSATPTITVTLIPNPTTTFASPGWGATETLPAGFVYVSTTADGMTCLLYTSPSPRD